MRSARTGPDSSDKDSAMPKSVRWTVARRATFLDVLRNTGNVSAAARAVGISRQRAYELRKHDPDFRREWQSAIEEAVDDLESELRRRAVEGTEKAIYYGGAQCGSIRNYSDNLGMFLLKGRRKDVFGAGRGNGQKELSKSSLQGKSAREILIERLGAMRTTLSDSS